MGFIFYFFLKIFYLFIQRERKRERQRHRQREKQAPCREPNMGLDPGSPGSHPGLQAVLNCCATRATLNSLKKKKKLFIHERHEREAETQAEGEVDIIQRA